MSRFEHRELQQPLGSFLDPDAEDPLLTGLMDSDSNPGSLLCQSFKEMSTYFFTSHKNVQEGSGWINFVLLDPAMRIRILNTEF